MAIRDIIFRGKRLDNGEWVESGSLLRTKNEETGEFLIFLGSAKPAVYIFNTEKDIVSVTSLDECAYYRVDPSSVGQYTGLTDRNGKKIFEGDIVLRFGCCYKVYFENGQWVAVDKHGFWVELYDDVTYTVIGNIHDNPDLLEGEG